MSLPHCASLVLSHLPGFKKLRPPNYTKGFRIMLCDLFVKSDITGLNYLSIKYFQNNPLQALDSQVMFRTFVYYRSLNVHNTKALTYFLQGNLVNFIKTKKNKNNVHPWCGLFLFLSWLTRAIL